MRILPALAAFLFGAGPVLAEPEIALRHEATDGGYRLYAEVSSDAPFEGRAKLSIRRDGAAGVAQTTQGSEVNLEKGESVIIAQVTMSFAEGDSLNGVATLLDQNDEVVDEAALDLN